MPEPSPARLPQLERLIEDALSLQRIILQNSVDGELRDKGFKFRYVIDTNIFDLLGEPARQRSCKMVAALPSLIREHREDHVQGEEDEEEEDHPREPLEARKRQALVANALLTSEYIFKLSGDDHFPVLVSPEHIHEIISYVDGLERRAASDFRRPWEELESVYAMLRDRLALEANAVRNQKGADEVWLGKVRASIVSLLAEASNNRLLAPYRIRNLFEGKAIANLTDALDLSNEIVSPPLELIMAWRTRITKAKEGRATNPYAVHADAVTLAQLELLNADFEAKKELCVLVTWDQGLHRAYRRWSNISSRSNGKIKTPFAVRDPRQFAPILNIADMSGSYSDKLVFEKLSGLVADFTSQYFSTDFRRQRANGDYVPIPTIANIRALLRTQGLSPSRGGFADQISNELRTIDEQWVEAIEYSIVAKADVISELANRATQLWSQSASHSLLHRSFAKQIENVRESFEILTTSSTLLRQEAWVLDNQPSKLIDAPGQNRRAVYSRFTDYSSPKFQGRTLPEILEDIREQKARAIGLLKEAERSERLFVTGCLSLQIGAWIGAKSLLDRAKAAAGASGEFAHEVGLFHAMAGRLAASQRDFAPEYRKIREALKALRPASGTTHSGEDPRVRNEQLALELCEIAFRFVGKQNIVSAVGRATQLWERMFERFGRRLTDEAIEPLWQSVSRQFILNTFDLLFWQHVAEVESSRVLIKVARDCLELLEAGGLDYATPSEHGRTYPLLAHYALASANERTSKGEDIENKIVRAIERDERLGISFDLPFVDKAEFAGILQIVAPERTDLIKRMSEEAWG